ncbi:MAG TPA: TlpA disulfide reductase family protein [Blastocatellia bacterium]|nr:TlpA disulfide reductase family protein [Blastocatellia bacterium]
MRIPFRMKPRAQAIVRSAGIVSALALMLPLAPPVRADGEYTGKLEPQLRVNRDGREHVAFRPIADLSKLRLAKPIEKGATVTAGRLYHVLNDKSAILTLLVEPEDEPPYLLADIDLNNQFDESERFEFKRGEEDNPYIWEASVSQPLKEGPFQSFPLFVQYMKNVRWEGMSDDERMLFESRAAFAAGFVDIQGRKTLVQYDYNARANKISVMNGRLGVDADGDGEVDFDPFSPEAAETQDEAVVFRVGNNYVSTKKVDLEKNLITMRSHPASDYKRIEVAVGKEMPDFEFTDFNGKKRRLSEFRGKHVLIDFWGMWCPPCRQELPYLKAAYSRFQARGFEILGLNTDQPEVMPQVKTTLEKNGMPWTQAKMDSIIRVIRNLRINSYPTTMLIGPDGRIISLNNTKKGQPGLRGNDLLKSLDKILPH